MSKSWKEIMREMLDKHEQFHQQILARAGQRRLYSVPCLSPKASGVSEEDLRICMEELSRLSDEDLKRAGLERVEGYLVVSDSIVNGEPRFETQIVHDDENGCDVFCVKFGREPTLEERQWAYGQAPFPWGSRDDPQAFPSTDGEGWWDVGNA